MIIGTAILTATGATRVEREDLTACQVTFERVLMGCVLTVAYLDGAVLTESLEVGVDVRDLLYFDAYGRLQKERP